jgi:hypothetical protein
MLCVHNKASFELSRQMNNIHVLNNKSTCQFHQHKEMEREKVCENIQFKLSYYNAELWF